MRIIALKTISDFYKKHQDAEQSLRAWYYEVKAQNWQLPRDVKTRYKNASILKNNRIVFNISGNKYRLIVAVKYELKIVYVRFIGVHSEYDKIDAENI